LGNSSFARATTLDLTRAVVVCPANLSKPEAKAVELLVDEVQKRTRIRWEIAHAFPKGGAPFITLISVAGGSAEGFSIRVKPPMVVVKGKDGGGMVFGVGRLLRELQMSPGKIALAEDFSETSAPRLPLRGHQLGYRPKTNSYDGWNLAQWEQYIRDLAVF